MLTFGPDGALLSRHQKYVPTVGERLVHAPGDRLEVGDGEGEGVQAPVPSDDVQRVGGIGVDRPHDPGGAAVLDEDLGRLVPGGADVLGPQRAHRSAQVALAVRRVLQQLAEA